MAWYLLYHNSIDTAKRRPGGPDIMGLSQEYETGKPRTSGGTEDDKVL